MIATIAHVGLMLAAGIIGTSIAIVFLIESIVGIGMIVVAVCERLVR